METNIEVKSIRKTGRILHIGIQKDSTTMHHLTSNMDNLEKFAREHYLMKRNNEDIYLIVRE